MNRSDPVKKEELVCLFFDLIRFRFAIGQVANDALSMPHSEDRLVSLNDIRSPKKQGKGGKGGASRTATCVGMYLIFLLSILLALCLCVSEQYQVVAPSTPDHQLFLGTLGWCSKYAICGTPTTRPNEFPQDIVIFPEPVGVSQRNELSLSFQTRPNEKACLILLRYCMLFL